MPTTSGAESRRPHREQFFARAHRRGSVPRRVMVEERSGEASAKKCKVNERHHSQTEQERVGLQVSDLKQPQHCSYAPGSAADAAHAAGIDDPAVKETGDSGEELLGRVNQPLIELI